MDEALPHGHAEVGEEGGDLPVEVDICSSGDGAMGGDRGAAGHQHLLQGADARPAVASPAVWHSAGAGWDVAGGGLQAPVHEGDRPGEALVDIDIELESAARLKSCESVQCAAEHS